MANYLSKFTTTADYNSARSDLTLPHVSLTEDTMKVHFDPYSPYVAVDLGLTSGLKWANMNIGATSETEAGMYFSWGNTFGVYAGETYDFSGIDWDTEEFLDPYKSTPGAKLSGDIPANATYDAARKNMGGFWRMPTTSDFQELYDECTWTWTTRNSVNGYLVTSKATGNTNSIFLPAAGYWYGGSIGDVGSGGYCWASSLGEWVNSCQLYFSSGYVGPDSGGGRCYGCPVRGVE